LVNSFAMNRLFFGDNLGWLRNKEIFPDAGVDLVYLDPPFNSDEEADDAFPFIRVAHVPDSLEH